VPLGEPLRGRMRHVLKYLGLPIVHPLLGDPALLSFLGFEEGSGDKASNDYTWTMANPARVSWVTGKVGKALQFNGLSGSYIETNCGTDFRLQTFSIALWFNASSTQLQDSVLYGYEGLDDGVWLILEKATGILYFVLWVPGPNIIVQSPSSVLDDSWHHVIVTWDGTNLIMCIDNVQVSSKSQTVTIPYSITRARIGANAYSSAVYRFKGIIDEFYLFSKVLSASERTLLYEV